AVSRSVASYTSSRILNFTVASMPSSPLPAFVLLSLFYHKTHLFVKYLVDVSVAVWAGRADMRLTLLPCVLLLCRGVRACVQPLKGGLHAHNAPSPVASTCRTFAH